MTHHLLLPIKALAALSFAYAFGGWMLLPPYAVLDAVRGLF